MSDHTAAAPPMPTATACLALSRSLQDLSRSAQEAGFQVAAEHLLYLALEVLDRPEQLRD
jgi:hypothetical protein